MLIHGAKMQQGQLHRCRQRCVRMRQPHDACRWLRVPDPGLGGHERERQLSRHSVHQHSCCGPHLDGVAQRRAGTVHLQHCHCGSRQGGHTQCCAHHILLAGAVGGGQAAAAPVLVDGSAGDQCERCLLPRNLCRQQQHDAARIRARVAVSCRAQGLAAPIKR